MQSTLTATTASGASAVAWLERANSKADTCILILHGHNSSGDRSRFITMAKWFAHHGFDACRWNAQRVKTGENFYRVTTVKEELDQARTIAKKLRSQYPRVVIIGHSQGGLLALVLATEGYADALVQLMPVVDTKENIHAKLEKLGVNLAQLREQGDASVQYAPEGAVFTYTPAFFDDFATYDMHKLYGHWTKQTLFVAGSKDVNIPKEEVERGYAMAHEPKKFVTVQDEHNFSNETAMQLAHDIAEWASGQSVE